MSILKAVLKEQLFEWQKILLFSKGNISLLIISQFDVTFYVFWFSYSNSIHICFLKLYLFLLFCDLHFSLTSIPQTYQCMCVYFLCIWTSQSLFFQPLFPFRLLLFKQCCDNHACRCMHAHLLYNAAFISPRCTVQGGITESKRYVYSKL